MGEWRSAFERVCEGKIGKVKVSKSNVRPKLGSQEIADLVKKRRDLWRKWVGIVEGQDKEKLWEEFKEARRAVRKAVGIAKQEEWRVVGEEIQKSFEENKRMFWARVKRLNGKAGKCSTGPVLGSDGKLRVDAEGKKSVWKQYFEGLGSDKIEIGRFDEEFRKEVEKEIGRMENESKEHENAVLDREFEVVEVERALKQMKSGKAAGEDGILTEFLKEGKEGLWKALVILFNTVWRSECVPLDWGRGVIVV